MAREERTKSRNDLLSEALIKQGCAAEKAARIACVDANISDEPKADREFFNQTVRRASWI
ncbi:hypothetical protein [Sphingobium boeckii]|uniref:Uncharacterized protein n=1 Tax=Sphingobium boeckii TaxID=1082345 RepID=A0A7W9AJM2_9SPHN|nr:hypothetical protein [Sphingobium boeckii]MBB5686918.1 hypothetical protein [Sphingobium boeckii]